MRNQHNQRKHRQSLTSKLIAATLATPSTSLSPIEQRLLSVASTIYTQHLSAAALSLGLDTSDVSKHGLLVSNPQVQATAWKMALSNAASLDDSLRELRDQIELVHRNHNTDDESSS